MQQDNSPIHLLSGGDMNYLPGIKVMMATSLAYILKCRPVVFHILNGGFSKDEIASLQKIAQFCHSDSHLVFHDITQLPMEGFVSGPGNSTMC